MWPGVLSGDAISAVRKICFGLVRRLWLVGTDLIPTTGSPLLRNIVMFSTILFTIESPFFPILKLNKVECIVSTVLPVAVTCRVVRGLIFPFRTRKNLKIYFSFSNFLVDDPPLSLYTERRRERVMWRTAFLLRHHHRHHFLLNLRIKTRKWSPKRSPSHIVYLALWLLLLRVKSGKKPFPRPSSSIFSSIYRIGERGKNFNPPLTFTGSTAYKSFFASFFVKKKDVFRSEEWRMVC